MTHDQSSISDSTVFSLVYNAFKKPFISSNCPSRRPYYQGKDLDRNLYLVRYCTSAFLLQPHVFATIKGASISDIFMQHPHILYLLLYIRPSIVGHYYTRIAINGDRRDAFQ